MWAGCGTAATAWAFRVVGGSPTCAVMELESFGVDPGEWGGGDDAAAGGPAGGLRSGSDRAVVDSEPWGRRCGGHPVVAVVAVALLTPRQRRDGDCARSFADGHGTPSSVRPSAMANMPRRHDELTVA